MAKRIDHVGIWTWGGRVYNWKRFIDNMQAARMDTAVFWHTDKPTPAAAEIQRYARERGVSMLWGFNWSWNSPVCLNSREDAQKWAKIVTELIDEHYAPLNCDGIVFQVGGTELTSTCRLDCEVCKHAYATGIGPLYVKFAGHIMDAVRAKHPKLKLLANIHAGATRESYTALSAIDPAVNIMWEDIPGPGWNIRVPFAYDWAPETSDLDTATMTMVRKTASLRGSQEDVAYILKGFPAHWGGDVPMLMEEFELELLNQHRQSHWDVASGYVERKLDQALRVLRVIADSPARQKTVLMLVECGLWELRRRYPVELVVEGCKNPYREPEEVIAATVARLGGKPV